VFAILSTVWDSGTSVCWAHSWVDAKECQLVSSVVSAAAGVLARRAGSVSICMSGGWAVLVVGHIMYACLCGPGTSGLFLCSG
jgi:hypothetical protein